MFASKTVFIIGAGASAEVGLPVGTVLASLISKKMDVQWNSTSWGYNGVDSPLFIAVLRTAQGVDGEYLTAAHHLRDGLPISKSIDEYLDLHRKNEAMVRLGKAAIVKTILEREHASKLFFEKTRVDSSFSFEGITDTWFAKLMYMLQHDHADRVFENASFVSFNYDRSLELFLFYAIRARFAVNDRRAREIVEKAHIFHPYGTVGVLPEFDGGVAYGSNESLNYTHLSQRIRLYTEESTAADDLTAMQKEIASARTLVFLGFAFHPQNMTLLAPSKSLGRKLAFATGYGVSEPDVVLVRDRIKELFNDDEWPNMGGPSAVKVHNKLRCAGLFEEYALTLPSIT